MAKGKSERDPSAAEKAGRGLTRMIFNTLLLLASLGVLLGWGWQGVYQLDPGESAVVLRLGAYERTQIIEGIGWHLPPPLESHEVVNTSELRTESFGAQPSQSTPGAPVNEEELEIADNIKRDAVQTGDGNIVNVAYELQYKVGSAFAYRFAMDEPSAILHDATEAAMRTVIGKKTIDSVLSQDRNEIEREVRALLETMLGSYLAEVGYEPAFEVGRINLEKPQAPDAVRAAFADVVSAGQDGKRSSLEATGDAQEILERARSEVVEIREQAEAFKRARIIEARGEATRFVALLTEYESAPEVTRRRLYLETMEEILPGIEKMIVEPNTVNMLPLLPLRNQVPAVGANQ
ncbi:MAG TPA: FtsH protease activity modulator HflK [Myxococcales bacterium]|nr:FtsH protease activity modulator HflK [Myxococcales bacterium]HIK86849.1 FtsH protease activity modulator HflK [Myxococcales bacterium]